VLLEDAPGVRGPEHPAGLGQQRGPQLLLEAGGPGLLVDTDAGPSELGRLLPSPFTQADLAAAGDGDG